MVADRSDGFGSRLRTARERKGISLREIAARTKISIAVLEALERNDVSRLPGGIFTRAFVRAYAHEVGLDPERAIQDFLSQFPDDSANAGHTRSDQVEDTELYESERRAASSLLWILGASVLLAGAVLYLSVARGDSGTPAASGSAASSAGPSPTSTAESSAGARDATAAVSASNTAPQPGEPAAAGTPRVAAASGPTMPGASAPFATGTPATATQPAPAPSAEPGADGRLTIRLAARRPVWISATVDGRKALGRLLQPGEQETMEVSREMVITAGDAAAVRMTLNGAEARPLGKNGEVVTARFTLANFKDYLVSR